MKIGIVTDVFPPDLNGAANTLHYRSKTLTQHGHIIRIIEHFDGRMEVVEYKKFMLERFSESL